MPKMSELPKVPKIKVSPWQIDSFESRAYDDNHLLVADLSH